jgi:TRAP-type C4-dicarboxylate transport system substrate-binding protein
MIDGAENNPPSFLSSRHFEVTKHYSLVEHTSIPDIVLFSQKLWDSMRPEVQNWVQQAADESVLFQRELWKQKTEQALALLKKAGVTIYQPDKKPFVDKVKPMYARLQGTKLGKLVERIKETR